MTHARTEVVTRLGVPEALAGYLFEAANWLEASGGPAASSYWRDPNVPLIERWRDEFFIAACLALSGAQLIWTDKARADWRLRFDGAYLFHAKYVAQAITAIDLLCAMKCYTDALTVVRSLHSRAQLLLLFSLGPHLFDGWLQDAENAKFRDSRVRKELSNHGLDVFPHFYHWFSDMVHGRPPALFETGVLESGLFPDLPAVGNLVFVASKLLLAVIGWIPVVSAIVDYEDANLVPIVARDARSIYEALLETTLLPSSLGNLGVTIPQDRHWPKADPDKVTRIRWFGYREYEQRLRDFHVVRPARGLGRDYARAGTESA